MEFNLPTSPWLAPPDSAIEFWHANRTAIILCTFFILVILRVYLHITQGNEPLHVFPKIYDEKTNQNVAISSRLEDTLDEAKHIKPAGPRRIKGELNRRRDVQGSGSRQIKTLVFYSSVTGNTDKIAKQFIQDFFAMLQTVASGPNCTFSVPEALDLAEVDLDEYFIAPPKLGVDGDVTTDLFYLFLMPSYNIDTINDTFLEHVKETHHDFRIDTAPLSTLLGYSVFGFGDKENWPTEEEGYCVQAKEVDKWMAKLTGRKRAYPLGMGDVKRDGTERMGEWTNGLTDIFGQLARDGTLGEGVPGSGDPVESEDEADAAEDDGEVIFEEQEQAKPRKPKGSATLDDLEDLGRVLQNAKDEGNAKSTAPLAVDFTTESKRKTPVQTVKEMVPKESPTFKSLTKQGYSIVGSHSGVKICRWTKSALRGRGSCYKFSFYGINSHQYLIFNGVKEGHYKKIKMMRGVPGVRAERFSEAMRIRHCALSLVGEPIFYPHINEFLEMLHGERISSFLVCNAQHPDQLAALKHVTQMYVSIDASNKESLRKIDRPLHRDFWERFQRCLEILREKRFKQRTVFRLTLVKGFNIDDEVRGYADLVEKALPCFVEVKGVTYCGTSISSSAGLTMANVPFYAEVCEFATALDRELNRRGLQVDGKWHTLIDYDRYFELLEERGPDGEFRPEEYMGEETPKWATWGNGGFDPRDQRVDRKGRPIDT
ncbi:putative wyosine base formation [Diaporthe ampelina]|uniref:tRNA 4-demethylwyosine synthase (AdoMet-dependent) n=1 Tax=Diaporthe ampelina TaxID=1214573 RepID=A0A0G2I8A9_9PEZI|nr:putative wyosine base formation [Diaporthe ampelina]